MGNEISTSSPATSPTSSSVDPKEKYRSFPGSALLEKTFCGSIDTTDPSEYEGKNLANRLLTKAHVMCIRDPQAADAVLDEDDDNNDDQDGVPIAAKAHPTGTKRPVHPSARLLARALVNEVTDNPHTMKALDMTERERLLLRAQRQAATTAEKDKIIGAPGTGVGPPAVLQSVTYALTGDVTAAPNLCASQATAHTESFEQLEATEALHRRNPHAVTIALCLSRHHQEAGHPDTVTRQTAFDLNLLQDRAYKFVSATDAMGWRAGGGEPGGDDKVAHADVTHIPILHLDCPTPEVVDYVITALASGDIFIPHMAVLPESLAVQGSPLPDLHLRWACERNDDTPEHDWPNWCLEFMHNQLYEYFLQTPAKPVWMARPFATVLARAVRWKTVKHMNRYFAHTEQVLAGWKDRGPQYLSGDASLEERTRPHGIYLLRQDTRTGQVVPTNYFAPNFDPPYTTKMTVHLLHNVMAKSWDKKRREWTSQPLPHVVSPTTLLAAACGCAAPSGFVAREVTTHQRNTNNTTSSSSGSYPFGTDSQSLLEPPIVIIRTTDPDGGDNQTDVDTEVNANETLVKASAILAKKTLPTDPVKSATSTTQSLSPESNQSNGKTHQTMSSDDEKNSTIFSRNDPDWSTSPEELFQRQDQHVDDDPFVNTEEKKSDADTIPKPTFKASRQSLSTVSGLSASVAASGTTVLHANNTVLMNTSQSKVVHDKSPDEAKRLFSDDDWVTTESQPTSGTTHSADPPGEKASVSPSSLPSKSPRSSSRYTMEPIMMSGNRTSPQVERDGSGVSLEYSADETSSIGYTQAQSLIGQQYASDHSVSTNGRQRSTVEDDESSMSYQTSGSTASVIPTDEELFAIGWAKAMDTKSGNYYYFTLDRKTIVWENPLTQQQRQ